MEKGGGGRCSAQKQSFVLCDTKKEVQTARMKKERGFTGYGRLGEQKTKLRTSGDVLINEQYSQDVEGTLISKDYPKLYGKKRILGGSG